MPGWRTRVFDEKMAEASLWLWTLRTMSARRQRKKLLMKLQEAEEAVKDESTWMSLDELKKSVGV